MTTLVRGPIKLVTDRPDTVRKINLRAPELRLHGAGIVTDHNDDIPVVGGQVEFEALPGPAVLTLVTAGGAPLRSVDIVVPDEDTATLAECLDQVYVYDPPVVGRAQQFAREAGEHAARAEAGADRVGSAEQVGAWVGEAEVLHDDTVAAAEHAQTQAGVATEQAGVAAGHAERAGEDRVQTGDDRRQTGEDRAQTGEDREAAEGWASQSKDAATLAITSAAALERHVADRDPTDDDTAYKGAIWVAPSQVWIRGEDAWHPISANDIDKNYVDAQDQALGRRIDGKIGMRSLISSDFPSLDDIRITDDFLIPTEATAVKIAGWPEGVKPSTAHLSSRVSSGGIVFHELHVFGGTGGKFTRRTASLGAKPWPFTPWVQVDAPVEIPAPEDDNTEYVGIANKLLIDDFTQRRGGVKKTGGVGAVAFRWDHGLKNFDAVHRPLHEARGIPYSLALQPRMWDISENQGITPAMVNDWVRGGLCEVWNHGQHHSDATDEAELETFIVTALEELREQIPDAEIDGFAFPGVGGTLMNGLNNGNSPEAFTNTYAGRLILKHHAVTTGGYPGTYQRVLDGRVRHGMMHLGMDGRPSAAPIIAAIDDAIENKTGLQLMGHPSFIDHNPDTHITTAVLTEILDYVADQRDAGNLAVYGPYDLLLADSTDTAPTPTVLDTGVRNVPGLLSAYTSASLMQTLERVENRVRFNALARKFDIAGAESGAILMTLPEGFRPSVTYRSNLTQPTGQVEVSTPGAVTLVTGAISKGAYVTFTLDHMTRNAWPSIYPGTPG